MHRRLRPLRHAFRYRVFCLLLDLDDVPALRARLWLFRLGVVGFKAGDHGQGGDLHAWLDGLLAREGIAAGGARRVLCYPRLFGYVFNPISTWFCHAADGRLAAIVYEVHNTYGERHAYVLPAGEDATVIRQQTKKSFFVSPFLSMDCAYAFKIRPPGDDVLVAIAQSETGQPTLTASFAGKRKPLTDAVLLGVLLRHPLMTLKVVAAIHYEAVRLMWKGVARHAHAASPRG
ncbi:MAG: DUF1365 domain-containing protein [Rhizomicrobium sp.]